MIMRGEFVVGRMNKIVEEAVSHDKVINILSTRIKQDGTRKWYQQLISRYGFIGVEVEMSSKRLVERNIYGKEELF